jgi:autotransporter passenger strand-loop-strand repeat protein
VSGGGVELVEAGGTAVSATVFAGAYEEVFSGGRASGASINNGGHRTFSAEGW